MLSPTIHGIRPPLSPLTHKKPQPTDKLFVLTFNRYRGTLFVLSPEEISLVENYHKLPGHHVNAFIRIMEDDVSRLLMHVDPVLCLAAKLDLRQRYESISRIRNVKSIWLDRYYSPSEKSLLHRYITGMMRRMGSTPVLSTH